LHSSGSLAPSVMTGQLPRGPDRGIVLEPGNDGGLVTSEASVKLVRAEGLEPSRALRPNGFSYHLRLSPPLLVLPQGLGSGLSLHRVRIWLRVSGAARLVSTPSRPFSGRAWLGIAMLQGSPNLSSSASPVSRRALKFALKSDASADSATPARFQVSTNERLARSDFAIWAGCVTDRGCPVFCW